MSKSVTITPVAGRVLLQVLVPPTMEGGIHLASKTDRGRHREAVVKALPPRYRGGLAVGDRVLVPPWPAREVIVGGDTLIFADEDSLPAALE
jgi:co-chaperonin GroES (HSP10)